MKTQKPFCIAFKHLENGKLKAFKRVVLLTKLQNFHSPYEFALKTPKIRTNFCPLFVL